MICKQRVRRWWTLEKVPLWKTYVTKALEKIPKARNRHKVNWIGKAPGSVVRVTNRLRKLPIIFGDRNKVNTTFDQRVKRTANIPPVCKMMTDYDVPFHGATTGQICPVPS